MKLEFEAVRDGELTQEVIVSPGEGSHEGGHREGGGQGWRMEEDRSGEREGGRGQVLRIGRAKRIY